MSQLFGRSPAESASFDAADLIALLDVAGIRRAVVLSVAYLFGSPTRSVDDEYAKVRAENDWTGRQAARYPGRLTALCGFNPLKDYALDELARCAQDPNLRAGIKLHFGNSDVQLDKPEHVEQLQRVFAAANDRRMAIVVHLRASISKQRPYGPAEARAFVEQVLPMAPDVPVQIAHMAASGPGYEDAQAASVMDALADAVAIGRPATRNLWFDVASIVNEGISVETAERVARLIRRVGVERILYGSDAPLGGNLRPREGWSAFRRLPLSAEELGMVAGNLAPYVVR